jgi:hypothetical protein
LFTLSIELSLTRNDFQVIEVRSLRAHIPPMLTHKRTARRTLHLFSAAAAFLTVAGFAPLPSRAEQLGKNTAAAFDQYVRSKEARSNQELAGGKIFLWVDALPPEARSRAYSRLQQGQIITRRSEECASEHCTAVPGGLIHDWTGIVFIPGVSMSQAIAALQDYDRDVDYYQPQVLQSKLLERSGDVFRVFLRLKQVKVVTVVLDTEYEIHYTHLDPSHAYSSSYSTRIAEVEHAGEPQAHDRPVGDDRGFLWRLYSYWRFYEADGGTYLQCDAVSLTRDVPAGLGWLIQPFIEDIPGESLRFTLNATRTALVTRFRSAPGKSSAKQQ